MSTFDIDFMQQEVEAQFDVESVPHPEGEYQFRVAKMEFRQWVKKDDPTISGVALDLTLEAMDEEVKKELGQETIFVRGGVPIEIGEDGKSIAKGKNKNVPLGRFLEACDCNRPGVPYSSAIGQIIMAKVKHDVVDDQVFARASKFAKID